MLFYVCTYNASELHVHPFHCGVVLRHMWHAQEAPHKSIGCHHDLQTKLLLRIYQKNICTLRAQTYTTGYSMYLLATIVDVMCTGGREGGKGGNRA